MEHMQEQLLDRGETDRQQDAPSGPDASDEKPADNSELSPEDIALGSKPPLRTLLVMTVGPLISQVTQAMFGFVDTIWIEMAMGDRGVTAISTFSNFENIGRAFGFFLNVAASTKISQLFGEGKADEAPQVIADLLRISVLFAILVPCCLIPALKPAAYWFGASKDIVDYGFEYDFYVILCAIIPILYMLLCGCLLAEGRTFAFGGVQIITLILNVVILDPVLLVVLRLEMFGNSLSMLISEGIPLLTVLTMYFAGVFGVKPHLRDLLKKFSPHTWPAMKVGFSQLFYQLSLAIPAIVLRKFLGMMSQADYRMFLDVVEAFNAQTRYYQVVFSVTGAVTMGFLPCASYAYGADRIRRLATLLVHATWICFAWCLFTMIFTCGIPRIMCRVFSSTPSYLDYAEKLLRNSNVVAFISPVALIFQALLQCLQMGTRASIISIGTQLVPLPVFSIVLYYTNKDDPARLLYAYAIQQAIGVVLALPLGLGPLIDVIRRARKEKDRQRITSANGAAHQEDETNPDQGKLDRDISGELEDLEPAGVA